MRVKKYLRPGSSPDHSSRSESCANPAAFSRRFASSSPERNNNRTESAETIREEKTREKERERGVRTDGVEGGGRRVEEVDEVGDDGSDGGHGRRRRCGRRGDCSMGTLVRSGVECSAVPLYALFNLFNLILFRRRLVTDSSSNRTRIS